MATQGGSNNTETQAEVHLKYVSEGYQKRVKELQDLALLIDKIKADLGSVTMPAIKGLKGALRDAGELSQAIQTLTRQGTVAGVTPVGKKASEEQKKAYQETKSRQVSDTAVRQAQLDTQDRTLKLQRQLAAETAKELQQRAFQGKLTKKEIEAQKGNVENLKAIAKGYKEASDSGIKPQVLLQRKVNNLIEADITARKQAQQKQRAAETQTRLEQNKIAVKFARQSLEGKNTGLAAYLKTADLNQVKAIENAMKAQSLKAGYTPTAHSQKLTEMVAARRADLTGVSKQVIDPKSILQSIQSAKHKGETDYIIKQLRAELNRQTKVGASRDSLVGLHGLLADARSEAVKKFAPVSPFQEAKKAEEAHAKSLAKLNENQLKQQNNRLLLEEHLQASKIRSHKTNMTIGSAEWKAEQSYQDLLKQRISAIKALETEQKRKDKDPIGTRISEATKTTRDANVDTILKNRQTAADKAAQRALDNEAKTKAITDGRFKTEQQIADLKQHELKFAKDTLNFGIQTGKLKGQERLDAEKHLGIIKQREAHEAKISQHNQNIRNLSLTHYKNENDLKGLKRAELEIAQKVIAYRIRNGQLTKEEAIAQQELYNAAKRRDHLLTAQAHRQDRERQNERRLGQLTHLEGDGGASMAIVQAGFMMRSQVLGGLSSIFSGAFDSAVQLDKAFRNLQAISASTNYEMATMKVNLINVAQASKFSASEVGETAVMLAQAGLSIQEIGASMKGIITLAQATGTDLAKSVDVVTSVLSIFNKSATETDTIVNQLTAALNESKLDINKMALGLQYAGNIASDSGVSFEELTAALGATANAGIRSGSTLGTGLRQMFIDLQKPNEKLTKRLETLGITLDQVSFRSQGLEGVLRNLRNAGFSSADAFETFEVRSAAAFSALSGNLTDFHDLQEELADTNAAFEANNVQMESFAVQIDHLKSNLGILAADGLGPVLSLLRDFARELAHAMENAEEGSTVLRVLTTSFAALTVGATLAWFAKLVWHIGTTTAALMGLGRAVSLTAFGWVGLVAAIITGLTAWESATAETARLNTELDEAKGKYNDLKAALSSYGSELTNVDGAIKDLINRYGVLSADTTQTEAVTKSLMSQFEQLGLVIDDVGSKHIDTILQKMRELRAEMAKKLLADTYETAAAEENKLYKELTAAHKTIRDNPALSTEDQASYVKKIISAEPKDLAKYEQVASAPAGKAVEAAKFALQIRKSLDSKEVSEELRTGFKELLQGLASTFEYSGKVPLNVFSAARTEYQIKSELGILQDKVAKRKLEQQLTKVMKQIEAVERTFNNPERLEKLRGETDRAAFKIQAKEIGYQPDKLLGLSQNLLANFNKELKGVNDQNHPIDLKRQLHSILAEEYLDQSGQYIEAVKKALVKAKEQGKSSMFIAELERQIGEASEMQHNYRKVLIESNKKLNKIRLNTLNEELKEAEAALKFAEEDFKLSTGSRRADGKYKVVQQKRQTVNELRRNILKLKLADNPESEETLESFDRKINSEAKSHALDKDKFYKSFKERAAESKNANLLEQGKKDLEARKAAEAEFYKELERKQKTLEGKTRSRAFPSNG
jgi:TP901 family phage tail tape measure protein